MNFNFILTLPVEGYKARHSIYKEKGLLSREAPEDTMGEAR